MNNIKLVPLIFDMEELPELYCPGFRIYMDEDCELTEEVMNWVLAEMGEYRRQRNLEIYKGEEP